MHLSWVRIAVFVGLGALFMLSLMPVFGVFFESAPIRWTNSPFPTADPVSVDTPLATYIERCNSSDRTIVTTVARRLVDEETGRATTLVPGAGIVDPGCTSQTGGIGLPRTCQDDATDGCVTVGRVYHIDQYVQFAGRWRTFTVPLRTQSFTVVGPDAP